MYFKASDFKAELFKVLAHSLRIQILDTLRVGEQSVNDIAQWLEVDTALVYKQLLILRRYNLVRSHRSRGFVLYSVPDFAIFEVLDAAMRVFDHRLSEIRNSLEHLE